VLFRSKDVRGFLSALIDRADLVVLTKPGTTRAADPEVLAAIAAELGLRSVVVPSPGAAIARALSEASEADLVLVTGSHYTVGDVLVSMGVGQALETG
jgi:dihydrofolate synthase/folylpolyglutamate synthase